MGILPIVLAALLLLVGTASAQSSVWGEFKDEAKHIPTYLLIVRYKGLVGTQRGDTIYTGWGWVYLTETYDTLDALLKRLNGLSGQSGMIEDGFIGAWKLGQPLDLKMDETEHVKPRHVEEERWMERTWRAR